MATSYIFPKSNSLHIPLRSFLPLLSLFGVLLPSALHAQKEEALLARADSLLADRQYDSALALYDRILASDPDNGRGLYGRGVVHIYRNEVEASRADLNRALALDPDCSRCCYWLGRGAILEGKNEEAMGFFSRAIGLDSTDAESWGLRATIQPSASAALDDFNRAVALDPDNAALLADRAGFYLENSSPMMALQDINSAIEIDSTLAAAYLVRAGIYLKRNDVTRTYQDVNRAIDLGYDGPYAYWLRGELNEGLGRIDSAIADYTACWERDPVRYEALHARAILRFGKEDADGACEDLQKVLELIGDNPEARAVALVPWNNRCDSAAPGYYYHRGIGEFNLENYAASIEWYNRGLKKFPESLLMRMFRGNSALQAGRYPLALQEYDYIYSRFDRYVQEYEKESEGIPGIGTPEIRHNMRIDLYRSYAFALAASKNYDRAIALVDSAIAIERDPSVFYNQRGIVHMWAGEWKKAMKDFETASAMNINYAEAVANRGLAALLQAASKPRRVTTLGFGVALNRGGGASAFSFPINDTKGEIDLDLVRQARADLDRAIGLNGSLPVAYELRAYARKLLGETDYCDDVAKVRELGAEPVVGLTPECR